MSRKPKITVFKNGIIIKLPNRRIHILKSKEHYAITFKKVISEKEFDDMNKGNLTKFYTARTTRLDVPLMVTDLKISHEAMETLIASFPYMQSLDFID